jgi:hypothetical protein
VFTVEEPQAASEVLQYRHDRVGDPSPELPPSHPCPLSLGEPEPGSA